MTDIEQFMNQHDVNQPNIVPGPQPMTPLESALAKLCDDSSKITHLEPRESAALADYIYRLNMIDLCETIEKWAETLDEEPPWYRQLVVELMVAKYEL